MYHWHSWYYLVYGPIHNKISGIHVCKHENIQSVNYQKSVLWHDWTAPDGSPHEQSWPRLAYPFFDGSPAAADDIKRIKYCTLLEQNKLKMFGGLERRAHTCQERNFLHWTFNIIQPRRPNKKQKRSITKASKPKTNSRPVATIEIEPHFCLIYEPKGETGPHVRPRTHVLWLLLAWPHAPWRTV